MGRLFSVGIQVLVIGIVVYVGGRLALAADEYDYDLVHSSVSFKARHLDISWIHGRFNPLLIGLGYIYLELRTFTCARTR